MTTYLFVCTGLCILHPALSHSEPGLMLFPGRQVWQVWHHLCLDCNTLRNRYLLQQTQCWNEPGSLPPTFKAFDAPQCCCWGVWWCLCRTAV